MLTRTSYEQARFDEAIEASESHSRTRINAVLDISPTSLDEWHHKNAAIRKEVDDAYKEVQKEREDSVVIKYPLSIPAGSTKRIDFDIPQQWESDLDSIKCLTVQTTKEVLHVKRAYAKPSLPCKKCKAKHRENGSVSYR